MENLETVCDYITETRLRKAFLAAAAGSLPVVLPEGATLDTKLRGGREWRHLLHDVAEVFLRRRLALPHWATLVQARRSDLDRWVAVDTEKAQPSDPAETIALRIRQAGGDAIAAAAEVMYHHPHLSRGDLGRAVPSGRTGKATDKSQQERGRKLWLRVMERYPSFPEGYRS